MIPMMQCRFRLVVLAVLASVAQAEAALTNKLPSLDDMPRAAWLDRYAEARQGPEQTDRVVQTITVGAEGFLPVTVRVTTPPASGTIEIALEALPEFEEEVVVNAARSPTRIQDQPLRVEVIDREEIEEKALMTPGSVAMLIGETTGLRVQPTAPSLGAPRAPLPATVVMFPLRKLTARMRRLSRSARYKASPAAFSDAQ